MPDPNGYNLGDPLYNKQTDPAVNPFYVAPAVYGPGGTPGGGPAYTPPPATGGSASSAGSPPVQPGQTIQDYLTLLLQDGSGRTPQQAADLAGQAFGLQPGQDGYPVYYANNGTIGLAGGYLALNGSNWSYTPRGPETGGGIGAPTVDPYTLPSTPSGLQTPYNATPFTAPTLNDLLASPGFQAGSDLLSKQLARSAAAHGSILSGGYGTALAKAQTDYATNAYGNLYNQALSGYQTNTGTQLGARQQNDTEFQNAVANTLSQYQQRYNAYAGAIQNQFNLASLGKPTPPPGGTGATG